MFRKCPASLPPPPPADARSCGISPGGSTPVPSVARRNRSALRSRRSAGRRRRPRRPAPRPAHAARPASRVRVVAAARVSVLPMASRSAPWPPIAWPNCCASSPSRFCRPQVAARRARSAAQRLGQGEVLEQRDDVGEGLVERQDVGIGRLLLARMQPVQQRMRRLMRHDVVGRQVKTMPPGSVSPASVATRGNSRTAAPPFRAVIGVRLAQRMRIDPQAADEAAVVAAVRPPHHAVGPERHAAKRRAEMADGLHRHRIDHLLVELRQALARLQPVLRQDLRLVQVDRRIGALVAGSTSITSR